MLKAGRTSAWLLAAAIVVFSLVAANLRPATDAPTPSSKAGISRVSKQDADSNRLIPPPINHFKLGSSTCTTVWEIL